MPRGAHFTREHQRAARRAVSSASCAANGAKGAAVTIERHGYEVLFQRSRRHRLLNPSAPERLIIGILSTLKIKTDRKYRLGSTLYTVDFYLPDHSKAIEVHGRVHRMLKTQERARNDERKRALLDEAGIDCLWITDDELGDVPALIEKIKTFVLGCSNCAGTGWIECGHPDQARRCDCKPAAVADEIPY